MLKGKKIIWLFAPLGILLAFYPFGPYVCQRICSYKWNAAEFSAYSSFVYTLLTFVLIGLAIFAGSIALKQLEQQNRESTQQRKAKFQQDTMFFISQFDNNRYVHMIQDLYREYFGQGGHLWLNPDTPLDYKARAVLRVFVKLGILTRYGGLDEKITIDHRPDLNVRIWLLLEEFVQAERDRNGIDDWQAPAQYLALISLKTFLKKRGDEAEIFLYNPDHPNDKDKGIPFYLTKLKDLRTRLETDLAKMGWPTVRPSEMGNIETKPKMKQALGNVRTGLVAGFKFVIKLKFLGSKRGSDAS